MDICNPALYDITYKFGYITKLKLKYFKSRDIIPEQELNWILNVSEGKAKSTAKIDKEDILLSIELLNLFHVNKSLN